VRSKVKDVRNRNKLCEEGTCISEHLHAPTSNHFHTVYLVIHLGAPPFCRTYIMFLIMINFALFIFRPFLELLNLELLNFRVPEILSTYMHFHTALKVHLYSEQLHFVVPTSCSNTNFILSFSGPFQSTCILQHLNVRAPEFRSTCISEHLHSEHPTTFTLFI
jgi:hypothetical protein